MLRARTRSVLATLLCFAAAASGARAGLTLESQFNPGLGELVGLAHDPTDGSVWVYGSFDADIRHYAANGSFLGSVPRPGESSDDFDLEIAPEDMVLGPGTPVPAGSLLVINGEAGAAEIYAVNKSTGAVLATLSTQFGGSHVVGGAWHPDLNVFFLVQDRQASGASNQSLVSFVDPFIGQVGGSFKVDLQLPGFTVNFGDLDISPVTGNLLIASSDESSLAEFTTAGTFVQVHTLPAGVGSPSGLGIVEGGNGAWVSNTSGVVSRLGNFPWTTLGGALAGIAGPPKLMGSGSQVAGAPTTLSVLYAKPGAASLVVGLSIVSLPFKGGTLVPSLDVLVPVAVDGFGSTQLPFAWPAGLPSGFALHYQVWMADAAGPKGFSASNGLRSITP